MVDSHHNKNHPTDATLDPGYLRKLAKQAGVDEKKFFTLALNDPNKPTFTAEQKSAVLKALGVKEGSSNDVIRKAIVESKKQIYSKATDTEPQKPAQKNTRDMTVEELQEEITQRAVALNVETAYGPLATYAEAAAKYAGKDYSHTYAATMLDHLRAENDEKLALAKLGLSAESDLNKSIHDKAKEYAQSIKADIMSGGATPENASFADAQYELAYKQSIIRQAQELEALMKSVNATVATANTNPGAFSDEHDKARAYFAGKDGNNYMNRQESREFSAMFEAVNGADKVAPAQLAFENHAKFARMEAAKAAANKSITAELFRKFRSVFDPDQNGVANKRDQLVTEIKKSTSSPLELAQTMQVIDRAVKEAHINNLSSPSPAQLAKPGDLPPKKPDGDLALHNPHKPKSDSITR